MPTEEQAGKRDRFVREGSFVALPLAFPDVTEPLPDEDSFVAALAPSPNGRRIYAGTSGAQARLAMAAPHATRGYVLPVGAIPDADRTAALLVHAEAKPRTDRDRRRGRVRESVVAAANGPAGGCLARGTCPGESEGIQEWGFPVARVEALHALPDEPALDLARFGPDAALLLTGRRVLRYDIGADRLAPVCDLDAAPATGRFLPLGNGVLGVAHADGRLVRIASDAAGGCGGSCAILDDALPGGLAWGWGVLPEGALLAADAEGALHRIGAGERAGHRVVGRAPLAPVTCGACLPDGAFYGFCGEGIVRFFRADAEAERVVDLSSAAAVLGVRRYGYVYADACLARDGEIVFAEHDRGGHLWLYFPPHPARRLPS